ncbi:hypothetical protein ACFLTE_02685 [Bacteroidota bacterium]
MKKKDAVLYYCHNVKEEMIPSRSDDNSFIQIKVLDQDNKDVVLDQLGFNEENELIKFVVHIMLRK